MDRWHTTRGLHRTRSPLTQLFLQWLLQWTQGWSGLVAKQVSTDTTLLLCYESDKLLSEFNDLDNTKTQTGLTATVEVVVRFMNRNQDCSACMGQLNLDPGHKTTRLNHSQIRKSSLRIEKITMD